MTPLVTLFFEHARDVAERGKVDVMLIASPVEVFELGDPKPLVDSGWTRPATKSGRPTLRASTTCSRRGR
jgi:hypothetical protein